MSPSMWVGAQVRMGSETGGRGTFFWKSTLLLHGSRGCGGIYTQEGAGGQHGPSGPCGAGAETCGLDTIATDGPAAPVWGAESPFWGPPTQPEG